MNSVANTKGSVYKSLQAGRAIAAIMVVLFHLGGAVAVEKYFGIAAFSIPFSFGFAGVEFFFVLSGFIILTAHRTDIFKPHRLVSYIKKRFIRIYPTYWIIFISVFVLAYANPTLRNTVPHDALIILKSLLLAPQDGGTAAPVLAVAWTLQYEMFFYLFFALMILSRLVSIIAGIAVLLIIMLPTLGYPSSSFLYMFLSQDYILLFVMGMVVSVTHTSKKATVNSPIFYFTIGTLLFLLIAADTVMQLGLLLKWTILLYGLASSLIIFGLVRAEDKGTIIGNQRWLQLLGDSSYALYLIHYPLISILLKLSLFLQLNKFGAIGAIIAYIAIFSACLISAVVFHLWIEKPVVAYLRSRLGTGRLSQQKA
jgi:exopolysaccharide production protein ExoZ